MTDGPGATTLRDEQLGAILARLDAVEEENRRLRVAMNQMEARSASERGPTPPSTPSSPTAGPDLPGPPQPLVEAGRPAVLGRRAVVAGAAGLAAVAASSAGATSPAAAADGNPLLLGSANGASSATGLVVTGRPPFGIAVADNGSLPPVAVSAIVGHARQAAFGIGVSGIGTFSASGVSGRAEGGVGGSFSSASSDGARASGGLYGVRTEGGAAALSFVPITDPLRTNVLAGSLQAVVAGRSQAHLWYCHTGNPSDTTSRWSKLAGPDTAGAFHLLPVPVRVYDSRPGTSPEQGPKSPLPSGNVARTIDLKANASGVPAGATGVLLTVLLVNAVAGPGNMTVWAADRPKPQSNTMVWGGTAGRFTATAMSAVDAQARVKLDASLQTDLVLDVVGYYR